MQLHTVIDPYSLVNPFPAELFLIAVPTVVTIVLLHRYVTTYQSKQTAIPNIGLYLFAEEAETKKNLLSNSSTFKVKETSMMTKAKAKPKAKAKKMSVKKKLTTKKAKTSPKKKLVKKVVKKAIKKPVTKRKAPAKKKVASKK